MTQYVYVIEYTDADGKSSAQGVYISPDLAIDAAKAEAREQLDAMEYDDADIVLLQGPSGTIGDVGFRHVSGDVCGDLIEIWRIWRTPLVGA